MDHVYSLYAKITCYSMGESEGAGQSYLTVNKYVHFFGVMWNLKSQVQFLISDFTRWQFVYVLNYVV